MSNQTWPSLGLLAACCGNVVKVWDPLLDSSSSGFRECRMTDDRRILSCAWNQSGKVLAYGGESGRIAIRNHSSLLMSMPPRSNPMEEAQFTPPVQTLVFSGDGKYIMSGTMAGTVVFWHLKRTTASGVITDFGSHSVTALAISPDGQYLAAGSSVGVVMTYRIPQVSKLGKYYAPESEPKRCLAFSDGLSSVLLASGDEKGKLFVWNAMNRTVRSTLDLHDGRISGCVFSTCMPSVLYTAGMDGKLIAVDTSSTRRTTHNLGTPLTSMAVSEDGCYIALGTADCKVRVFDIRQLAAPVSESVIHTQRTRMAVTSVAWQKSEVPMVAHRGGYDPLLGQESMADRHQDAYMDSMHVMEPPIEDDDARVNPPNIPVVSPRLSTHSGGGSILSDRPPHNDSLHPEPTMRQYHATTPAVSPLDLTRRLKWGGDAAKLDNPAGFSSLNDIEMADSALDPLENSFGASFDRPLSARSTPREEGNRRSHYGSERPRPPRRPSNGGTADGMLPCRDITSVPPTTMAHLVNKGRPDEQIDNLTDVVRDLRTEMVRQRIEFAQQLEEQEEQIQHLRKEIDRINCERVKEREFTGHF